MTSLEAYENLLLKVNRNDSNSNIEVSRGQFVNIYNEQRAKWTSEKLSKKLSSDQLDELQDLLEDDVELLSDSFGQNSIYFKLPSNFYKVASSFSLAEKNGCERILTNWNTKSTDRSVILNDENINPSFDYEETPINITKDKLKVYFTDFKVKKVYLSYYKQPQEIDLEGYIKSDGTQSTTINPDISDANVLEIITRCAAEVMRNNQNPEGLQFQKDRIPFE